MHCQLTPNVFSFQYKIEKRANSDDEEEEEDEDDVEFGGSKKKQEEVDEDPLTREFIFCMRVKRGLASMREKGRTEMAESLHESHSNSSKSTELKVTYFKDKSL